MLADLEIVHLALGVVVAVLTIVGTTFGWFGKVWHWLSIRFRRKKSSALFDIPKKTVILLSKSSTPFTWNIGTSFEGKLSMQVYGDLQVTNICKYDILLSSAKMRKPKALGYVNVSASPSQPYGSHMIPGGTIADLIFHFSIMPPVKEKGQVFKADVAIIDQFGNEHWVNGIEFKYS
jgi:hypothetical protein